MVSHEKKRIIHSRWDEILAIWAGHQWLFVVMGWILGLITVPALGSIDSNFWGFLENLVPEFVGIAITVLIIERVTARQMRLRLQNDLILLAKSQSNELAKFAIDYMRHENWLVGSKGILRHADLSFSNLSSARLIDANLEGANLEGANLREANLRSTNLQNAKLNNANLMWACLEQADLDGADLSGANLAGANMLNANLLMANTNGKLTLEAFIKGDSIAKATLPDGTQLEGGDDISRFFNPDHANVFVPSWLDLEERRKFW